MRGESASSPSSGTELAKSWRLTGGKKTRKPRAFSASVVSGDGPGSGRPRFLNSGRSRRRSASRRAVTSALAALMKACVSGSLAAALASTSESTGTGAVMLVNEKRKVLPSWQRIIERGMMTYSSFHAPSPAPPNWPTQPAP